MMSEPTHCTHPGCDKPWTIRNRYLCTAHAAASHAPPPVPSERRTLPAAAAQAREALKAFAERARQGHVGVEPGPEWAFRLRERERRGERLTQSVRESWREVVGRIEGRRIDMSEPA